MAYKNLQGKTLSKSKLTDTVKAIRPSDKTIIAMTYHNYVPQDKEYTLDEQLGFIIAAMPGMGRYPAKDIANILARECTIRIAMGTTGPKDPTYSLAALAERALTTDPALCQNCMAMIRKHKHVPAHIKNNDGWALQLAIATAIGDITGNAGAPTEPDAACAALLDGDGLINAMRAMLASRPQ